VPRLGGGGALWAPPPTAVRHPLPQTGTLSEMV